MESGLVSVIIPAYNAEKHIRKCIDSIINQTYSNLEIIIVNDGSKDRTEKICEEYKKIDNRIVVISQENKGVSTARNVGLEVAKGEYISFIDSDDTLEKDAYKICINEMKNKNADIVVFKYRRIDTKTDESVEYGIDSNKEYSFPEILEDYLNDKKERIGEANWNKLFKYNVIKDIRFKKLRIGEDFIFNYEAFKEAKKIINIPICLYNYEENSNSVTLSDFNKDKLLEYIESRKYVTKDVEKKYKQYYEKAFSVLCDSYYYSIEKFIHEINLKKEKDFLVIVNKFEQIKNTEDYNRIYKKNKRNEEINNIIENYKVIIKKERSKRIIKGIIKKITPKKILRFIKKVKKRKKIGIITINDDNNYGNRLQNYAVQELLKRYNAKVETIYNFSNLGNLSLKKLKLKNRIKMCFLWPIKKYRRSINFAKFNKKIKFSKIEIHNENNISNKLNDKYDIFFTGSDQVWNPYFDRTSSIDFLEFATENKRNSISASFGVGEIPKNEMDLYAKRLNKFNHISVREQEGKEIIEKLTGRKDVEVLLDPTMILEKEIWDKVSKKPKQLKSDKYILNYFLGKLSNERKEEIERIAKENNCKIINILDEKDPFYESGPSEFLYLEKNAFLICTDSFHSSVFAILYGRPFVVFNREDRNKNMNSRIDTLLDKFGLQESRFNVKIKDEQLESNYEGAYQILKIEREKFNKFIMQIMNDNNTRRNDGKK